MLRAWRPSNALGVGVGFSFITPQGVILLALRGRLRPLFL